MLIRARNIEKETLLSIVGIQAVLLLILLFIALRACTFVPELPQSQSLVIETEPSIEQDMLIAQAENYIAQQDYQSGITLLDVTIQHSQPNARIFGARAAAYAHVGDLDNAIADYQQAIQLDPNNADYRMSLCYLAAESGDYQTALPNCDTAISLMPNSVMAWNNRCYIRAYYSGDYAGAISDCNQASLLNVNHPFPYNNRARAYLMLGAYQQAIDDATHSINLGNPYAYLAYTNRGTAYAALGNANAAISDYQAAVSLNPDYDEVYARLGELYRWQNRPAFALQAYCRYLEVSTNPIQFVQERAAELGGCQ